MCGYVEINVKDIFESATSEKKRIDALRSAVNLEQLTKLNFIGVKPSTLKFNSQINAINFQAIVRNDNIILQVDNSEDGITLGILLNSWLASVNDDGAYIKQKIKVKESVKRDTSVKINKVIVNSNVLNIFKKEANEKVVRLINLNASHWEIAHIYSLREHLRIIDEECKEKSYESVEIKISPLGISPLLRLELWKVLVKEKHNVKIYVDIVNLIASKDSNTLRNEIKALLGYTDLDITDSDKLKIFKSIPLGLVGIFTAHRAETLNKSSKTAVQSRTDPNRASIYYKDEALLEMSTIAIFRGVREHSTSVGDSIIVFDTISLGDDILDVMTDEEYEYRFNQTRTQSQKIMHLEKVEVPLRSLGFGNKFIGLVSHNHGMTSELGSFKYTARFERFRSDSYIETYTKYGFNKINDAEYAKMIFDTYNYNRYNREELECDLCKSS